MDSAAVSRRNHTNKKGNKENAQPVHGSKSFIRGEKTYVPPFQLKGNKREDILPKNDVFKAKANQADVRSASAVALKNAKPLQREGREAGTTVKQRQTHTQAFRSEQAVRHTKIVAQAPKPPVAVSSLKAAPGMYKGKIIQSKIGSIWKSSTSLCTADLNPSVPKTEKQGTGNVAKPRSKSVTDMPGHSTQRPATVRSKSVVDRSALVSKPPTTRRPPAKYCPPTRTVPTKPTATSSRNTTVAPTKVHGTQNSKPKVPVTDKKVNKPPVSRTLSQYRFNVETAEERRAKLAEWMASKGKTFKRPAMATAAAPSKTKADVKTQPEPQAQHEPQPESEVQTHTEAQSATHCQPEASLEAHELDSAAQCADNKDTEQTAPSQTPAVMNTTLDLLENSDADLSFEPQDRVDDIVVNLCDALEAMSALSECRDELAQVTDACNDVEMESSKACEKEELKNEIPEVSEEPKTEKVKDEAEECDDQKVKAEDDEEVESDDDCVMETTPQIKDASVIKYSVKTTPYLQSVKKTIEGEISASGSRRKSNIKDLKFLTPVRRSCRIQRKSSCLPTMLTDHDPCVSSLAELVTLDDDPNAYIYRKNTALLEDLPDKPRL